MAGDWIKMRTALANDPAVIAIACGLDKAEFEIVGMLHHIWSWADSQSQDGHVKRVTRKWVDRFVHCDGFATEMETVGWLVIDDAGITFPNFDRHNGESAKKRAEATERKRKSRVDAGKPGVTALSHDTCDKNETREEKRREEQDQDLLSLNAPLEGELLDDERVQPRKPEKSKPPLQKILALYNEICGPTMKRAVVVDKDRERNIQKCWDFVFEGNHIFRSGEFWKTYFTASLLDQHWQGDNDRKWKADLEFITRPSTVSKILEMIENAAA